MARRHAQEAESALNEVGGGGQRASTHANLAVYYQLRANSQSASDSNDLLVDEIRLLSSRIADSRPG